MSFTIYVIAIVSICFGLAVLCFPFFSQEEDDD